MNPVSKFGLGLCTNAVQEFLPSSGNFARMNARPTALWVNAVFRFEWDEQKAASNLKKHGVSFDEALSVFADALELTFADTDHSDTEDRSRTYGVSSKNRLLVVVHTERFDHVRIISA